MGLYELAIIERNGFNTNHKPWSDFKSQFGKGCDTRLRSGVGTANANGYHITANHTDAPDNDIISSFRESFSAIQVANNANFKVTNGNMSAMTQDLQTV